MGNSNRCPNCGGIADTAIVDVAGKSYYHCLNGLTTFGESGGEITRQSQIVPCDTLINREGQLITGTIAYRTEHGIATISATNGKIRR